MQDQSDRNPELLDAAVLCAQLVPRAGSRRFGLTTATSCSPTRCSPIFPSGRGRPSIPADVIATAMVLQALEGLSDGEAARAVRDRIGWKVACGLALDEDGFDYSVLTS